MIYGQSTPYGKPEIRNFIMNLIPKGSSILDVGAGSGTYYHLLGSDYKWSAVEIWHDAALYLQQFYTTVYEINIKDFEYTQHYDLIMFGDILEHLTVADAQSVLEKANQHACYIMVGVPYNYQQGALYGNNYEQHLQPDLTPIIFNERYQNFNPILISNNYGYYYWKQ